MSEIHESHPENVEVYVAVRHAAARKGGEPPELFEIAVSFECDDNLYNRDYQIRTAKSLLAEDLRAFRLKGKEDRHEIGPVPEELVGPVVELVKRRCAKFRWPCKVMGPKRGE